MRSLLLIVPLLWVLISCSDTTSNNTPESEVEETIAVPEVIELTGSGYERGLQHGKILKNEIANIVAAWKENVQMNSGKDPEMILDSFFLYASFDNAIKKWTPDLYEEIKGIAEGSGQSFRDIMVLNLLDEFWVYIDDLFNHHCSGVGVPSLAGEPAYIAQNMDLEQYTDGYQVIFRIAGTDSVPEQLILSHAGLIALNGMNRAGIGVCVNTLMQLKASNEGVPVAFIVRRIISSTDRNELIRFIQSVPHASGQNYILGIKNQVFDFEASANKVVRFDPGNPNGSVYHTNHPIVNEDIKPWHKNLLDSTMINNQGNSLIRFASLEKRMPLVNSGAADTIQVTLRSKDSENFPVCRPMDSRGGTFASVIMSLGDEPGFKWTVGSPDKMEYVDVPFANQTKK